MELSQHTLYAVQFPWFIYGTSDTRFHVFSMGFCPYEIIMDCPWNTHGVYTMGIPWTSHGDFIWAKTHRKLMEYVHDISMGHFYKG